MVGLVKVIGCAGALLLVSCGQSDSDQSQPSASSTSGGSASGSDGTAGAAPAGGGAAGGTTIADSPCTEPLPGLGSCYTNQDCTEGVTMAAASANLMGCVSSLNRFPDTEPCNDFQMLGRCFDPATDLWRVHYQYFESDPVLFEAQCLASGGVWCVNPAGTPVEVALACKNACDAARPDYSDAPECLLGDLCFNTCLDRIAAQSDGCIECVTESISWLPGFCNDFECNCPPATFGPP